MKQINESLFCNNFEQFYTDTIIADLLSRQTLRLAGMKNNLFNFDFDHSTTS